MTLATWRAGLLLRTIVSVIHHQEILTIMDWFPIVAGTFKVLVLGIGMFFAIKWHYDKGKEEKAKKRERERQETAGS